MNAGERKIAFIICGSNEQYLSECLQYIGRLRVPPGYDVETLSVPDVGSICSGYNEAMRMSTAKYKVYLRQELFLVNPDFLSECLDVFERDSQIGLIGTLGVSRLPGNALAYNTWDTGDCLVFNGTETRAIKGDLGLEEQRILPVEAVNGMLMITSRDIPWREDLFDSHDFYDISQSMEFSRAGYKIVVPAGEKKWCIYDCSQSSLAEYDKYRKIFCGEYGDRFTYDKERALDLSIQGEMQISDDIFGTVTELLDQGNVKEGVETLGKINPTRILSDDLRKLCLMAKICAEEQPAEHTFLFGEVACRELMRKYDAIRFLLRRIEFDFPKESYQELVNAIYRKDVSQTAIERIIGWAIFDGMKVMRILAETSVNEFFQRYEKDNRKITMLYENVSSEISTALKNGNVEVFVKWRNFLESGEGENALRYSANLNRVYRILKILQLESRDTESDRMLFLEGTNDYGEVLERYLTVLFAVRRLLFQLSERSCREALDFLREIKVSPYAVYVILAYEIRYRGVWGYRMMEEMFSEEWTMEERRIFHALSGKWGSADG